MQYDNLTLLTDFYEFTMMQGFFNSELRNATVVFDLYYRKNPCGNGFSIAAGLEQAIEYIKEIRFSREDIDYLKSCGGFSDEFCEYLKDFRFIGDIYAVPEGTVVFPNEPMLRVTANIIEAQLLETALLNIINHQSLIATKAARVVFAAGGDAVLEFGLRRAQAPDAGVFGARAAIIGGAAATSNVLAGKMFDLPVRGTHAHSWVMSFDDELSAFRAYAKNFPNNLILLVDTYDTLNSGVPNAIKVFKELKEEGKLNKGYGIRLDSGDIAYISKKSRKMLDENGFEDAIIVASSDLDENLIKDLKLQGAKVNVWGVGTNLITSYDCPAFGGVYKLCAQTDSTGNLVPKIKLSDNPEKITNPGVKKIVRFYDKESGKVKADLITLDDEKINENEDNTIFDPLAVWKRMTLKAGQFYTRELLVPIFIKGECVYQTPTIAEIKEYCQGELNSFWDEHKRLINPHTLPVDLSYRLWKLKEDMINTIAPGRS